MTMEDTVLGTGTATPSTRYPLDPLTGAEIEAAGAELKTALEGDDEEAIKAKTDTLMQASHKLAEAVYQQAQQQQSASGGEGGGSTTDENVEDGDFEVIDEDESK